MEVISGNGSLVGMLKNKGMMSFEEPAFHWLHNKLSYSRVETAGELYQTLGV
jgi:hypothetical protein